MIITTRIIVAPDGTISVVAPLPAGSHTATITVVEPPPHRRGSAAALGDFPIHDEPWDDNNSLRREHLYDDDGRLR